MGKAIKVGQSHAHIDVTIHAPWRVHLTFAALRALRIPEHVALDLIWKWWAER